MFLHFDRSPGLHGGRITPKAQTKKVGATTDDLQSESAPARLRREEQGTGLES